MNSSKTNKKGILRLITLREIRKSFGRFLAIFAITAIGVGFFCGLRISTPVMIRSMDRFYKEAQLFDYRLLSTVGWSDKDVDRFRQKEGVKAAEGAWQYDLLVNTGQGETLAFRIHSLTEHLNAVRLAEGRMPENEHECLMDAQNRGRFALGETLVFSEENDEDSKEAITGMSYSICGFVDASLYVNFERGTTAIGGGTLSGYIYLPKTAFTKDHYTEIYVKLKDDSQIFSDSYEEELDAGRKDWESVTQDQADARHDELYEEVENELADAKEEFEEKKSEGEEELADAKTELDDAKTELDDAGKQLREAKEKLEEAKRELDDAKAELDEGDKELTDAALRLNESFQTLNEKAPEIEAAKATLAENKAKLDTAAAELSENLKRLNEAYEGLMAAGAAIDAGRSELKEKEAQTEAAAAAGWLSWEEVTAAYAEIEAGRAELDMQAAAYEQAKAQYDSGMEAYDAGRKEYEAGRTAYEAAEAEFKKGEAEYMAGRAAYEQGVADYEAARQALEDGKKEYEEGLARYEESKEEYQKNLDAYKQGRKDYREGLFEYTEGKAEYDEEIKDAEGKIADAEKELADFESADSWLLERNTNIAYACFESDSQIVRQIATVFPIFFMLVAALVCATTMTRMIEEQRGQIGTLKGLGYTPREIMRGYLAYAGTAAVLGCLVGYAVGIFVFPTVIWKAYQIMYITLPLHYLFDPLLFFGSMAAALLCSLGTAYLACRSSLKENVAELMRPKAPQPGKRILLEHFPRLWSRFSFMRKVSLRNIFRYKKRLLMMILGIGGCTALLLTGFGIKDSISGFAKEQFSHIQTADAELNFTDGKEEAPPAALAQAMKDMGASGAVFHRSARDLVFRRFVRSADVIAPYDEKTFQAYFALRDMDGNTLPLPAKGEALIGVSLSERYGISHGDSILLRDADMNGFSVKVVGIFENYVNNYVVISPQTLRAAKEDADANALFIRFPEGSDVHRAQTSLADLDSVTRITVLSDFQNRLISMMDALNYVVLLVILSAAALAFVVLYNLTNINIIERIREIATIKVLGFRRRETSAYIFRENLVLTLFGVIAGILLGILLHRFVMSQIKVDLVWFPRRIAPASFGLSVLLTFFFTFLVNLFMSRRLRRINMAESLKSVE